MTSRVDPLRAIADLAQALAGAELRLPRLYEGMRMHMHEPLDFEMWTQQWSDTSCGFGGIAGQAFTFATVVMAWRERGDHAVVFIAGQFAYPVHNEDPRSGQFWADYRVIGVPGAALWADACVHVLAQNSNVCLRCGRGQPLP